ncbi:MAG: zinc ribbon domain-containing protein [Peptococcaceae bacterium]|nr:zinc ribbon domain-containing protein [Peptococcaceae bacterium]
MKTLSQEIMALDFRRVGKNYALAAVVVLVVCVGLGAFLLWPQLGEAWALLAQGQGPLEWRLDMLEDAWEWSLAGYGGGVLSAVGLGARTALLVSGLVLVGLVGNLAAVALFFAARSLLRTQCAGCGGWSAKSSGYCRHCGTGLGDSCPSCGQSVAAKDIYCVRCGTPLGHENG